MYQKKIVIFLEADVDDSRLLDLVNDGFAGFVEEYLSEEVIVDEGKTYVEDVSERDIKSVIDEHAQALETGIDEYIQALAKEINVSEDCASDVLYLRTRSRWTPELELKLIDLHKKGTPPNINEFGNP